MRPLVVTVFSSLFAWSGSWNCGACPAGQEECSGACVAVATDPDNCGACGTICGKGTTCQAGACVCPGAGQTDCAGACVSLQTDDDNCGACGHVCTGGTVCSAGSCACPSGQTSCNGSCVNLETNASHCGSCSTACTGGEICSSGSCACASGSAMCSGSCVNEQSDSNNCGGCGTVCSAGRICSSGSCACPLGEAFCGSACVNTANNNANCGGCGIVCPTGLTCAAGSCIDAFCGGFTSITVTPSLATQTVAAGAAPAPVTLSVSGNEPGGGSLVIPLAAVTFSTSRSDGNPVGTFGTGTNLGLFTPPAVGGANTITATVCGFTAHTTTSVVYGYATTVGGGSSSVWTGATTSGGAIVYPSNATKFPMNMYGALFEWSVTSGDKYFRLTFKGANGTSVVYTDGKTTTDVAGNNLNYYNSSACTPGSGYGCWVADATTWQAVAGSNAGGSVTVEVDGTKKAAAAIHTSATITLYFSSYGVPGVMYYWGTTSAATWKSSLSAGTVTQYLSPSNSYGGKSVSCAGCHAFSRDGRVMSASVTLGSSSTSRWSLGVATTAPTEVSASQALALPSGSLGWPGEEYDGYANVSPDDTKLAYSGRSGSTLEILNALTGGIIAPVSVNGTSISGRRPDWSPFTSPAANLGKLVYEDAKGGISTVDVTYAGASGSGATQVTNVSFANVRQLVGGPSGFSFVSGEDCGVGDANSGSKTKGESCYPTFDYEGDAIVYATVWPDAGSGNAALAAMKLDGGVVNLAIASGWPTSAESSMPTWTPTTPTSDTHWIAFNTTRAYGQVLASGQADPTGALAGSAPLEQMWVAAVDNPATWNGTIDPSHPAFYFPLQHMTESNHFGYWVLDSSSYTQQTFDQSYELCDGVGTQALTLSYASQGVFTGSDIAIEVDIQTAASGGTTLATWKGNASTCPSPINLTTPSCGSWVTGGPSAAGSVVHVHFATSGNPPPSFSGVTLGAACSLSLGSGCATSPATADLTSLSWAASGLGNGNDIQLVVTAGAGQWSGDLAAVASPAWLGYQGSPASVTASFTVVGSNPIPPSFTSLPAASWVCPSATTETPCQSATLDYPITGFSYAASPAASSTADADFAVTLYDAAGSDVGSWTGAASRCPSPVTFASCGSGSWGSGAPPNATTATIVTSFTGANPIGVSSAVATGTCAAPPKADGGVVSTGSFSVTDEPCSGSGPEFTEYEGLSYAAAGVSSSGGDDIQFTVSVSNSSTGSPAIATWTGTALGCNDESPVLFANCGTVSPSGAALRGAYLTITAKPVGTSPPAFTQNPTPIVTCAGN
ncbi:MAG TPA: MXAN_6577-like cysteine-rich protein [Myxococcales bacterium]|nr:MXAN_6577-like cysteine-rich protein [Myxococcales bacterium]